MLFTLPHFDVSRFTSKIDYSQKCWLWTAGKTPQGYGVFGLSGRRETAHRIAYYLAYGPFLRTLHVCHHCDTPACCKPQHLFLGTNSDNRRDAFLKGRVPKGKQKSKTLTDEDIQTIDFLRRKGATFRMIAEIFSIDHSTAWKIVHRKRWTHIPKSNGRHPGE